MGYAHITVLHPHQKHIQCVSLSPDANINFVSLHFYKPLTRLHDSHLAIFCSTKFYNNIQWKSCPMWVWVIKKGSFWGWRLFTLLDLFHKDSDSLCFLPLFHHDTRGQIHKTGSGFSSKTVYMHKGRNVHIHCMCTHGSLF